MFTFREAANLRLVVDYNVLCVFSFVLLMIMTHLQMMNNNNDANKYDKKHQPHPRRVGDESAAPAPVDRRGRVGAEAGT